MIQTDTSKKVLTDGSEIIIEALVRAGANAYVNYPITPSNWLNAFASKRFPFFMPAPDEISTLQWLSGLAVTGKIPVTATSYPGFALMVETMNMAYMMELPIVVILVQRLGPSTGSATVGAQGDLLALNGTMSGGFQFPVLSISNFEDCWNLSAKAVETAVKLRTPVVLLTSKEMIMTTRSFDISKFENIESVDYKWYEGEAPHLPYEFGDSLVPEFLPAGNDKFQVRINASTHDKQGLIRKATPEAVENSLRLQQKVEKHLPGYTFYNHDKQQGADVLVVSYGISCDPCRDALATLRKEGRKVSLLIPKTLLPIPGEIIEIIDSYKHVVFVEENMNGLLVRLIYGHRKLSNVRQVNGFGKMITPDHVRKEVLLCK